MTARLSQKLDGLAGFMFGCPVCGGHRYDQILNKRRRAREKRMWKKDEQ